MADDLGTGCVILGCVFSCSSSARYADMIDNWSCGVGRWLAGLASRWQESASEWGRWKTGHQAADLICLLFSASQGKFRLAWDLTWPEIAIYYSHCYLLSLPCK